MADSTEIIDEVNEDVLREEEENKKRRDNDNPDLLESLKDDSSGLASQDADLEEIESTKAQLLADFIRHRSNGAILTKKSDLASEEENLEVLLNELLEDPTCQDIVTIEGSEEIYFYSEEFMSDNYAMIAMLIDENNLPKTIATIVRWNAKVYPTPTPVYYFTKSPYNYTEPQIDRALKSIEKDEQYSDMGEVITGNDVRYLYSDLHMSKKYALSLAEGVEYGEYGYDQ